MKLETPPIEPPRSLTDRKAVTPPVPASGEREGGDGGSRQAAGDERRRQGPPAPQDVAAVHGIVEAEMTDAVRAALSDLVAEIGTLHGELEQSRNRLTYITLLADQDPVSEALNRRAFVREVSRLQTLALRERVESALVLFHVPTVGWADRTYGLAAGDAVARHVADVLLGRVEGGDIVGHISGALFAVTFVGKPLEAAEAEAAEMVTALRDSIVEVGGEAVAPDVAIGTAPLPPGGEVAAALGHAELNLRLRREAPPR